MTSNFEAIMAEIEASHVFECECGERYRTVEAARRCRKCGVYLYDEDRCGDVVDLRTGALVYSWPVRWDVELRGADRKPTFGTFADIWKGGAR